MTLTRRQPSRLDPGKLISAIPALLRFRPADSVVVVGFTRTAARLTVRCVLRIDIPAATEVSAASEQLSTAAIANEIDSVAVVIIAESGDRSENLPHRGLQRALVRAFDDAHVEVADTVWVERIEPGMRWRSYEDPGRAGTLTDPSVAPVTAAVVLAGAPIYASRADLVDHLAADPAPVLARRADQLAALPPAQPERAAELMNRLLDRIAADPTTEVLLDEDTLLRAAHALSDPLVREACLEYALSERVEAGVRLWTVLTRCTPPPVVAHPASLLAAAVYLRGDGTLAHVAVDIALAADPTHPLAQVLRTCLDHTIPPDQFRQLLTDSFQAARRAPVTGSGSVPAAGDTPR